MTNWVYSISNTPLEIQEQELIRELKFFLALARAIIHSKFIYFLFLFFVRSVSVLLVTFRSV